MLLLGAVAAACGGEESPPASAPTQSPTAVPSATPAPTASPTPVPSPTSDASGATEVEFWELDLSSTGQDLVAFLTDEEAACLKNELGADYARMLEVPLAGEAGALVEEGGSDAFPLPRCFSVERAASMSLSLFSAAADGLSAGTRECMLQLLADNPAIAEALGRGQAFIDGPAILEIVVCLSPEEAEALTPARERPSPDTAGIQCLIEELQGTTPGDRIIAVLSGADSSGVGLTMEESAMLGQAVEACGIETDFGFLEPADGSTPGIAEPPSDPDDVAGDSTECAVGLILNPGDECSYDDFTMRIREDGAAVLDGNIGGISMGNTVMDAQSINLNRFSASRSGSTWTIESLP